MWLYQRYYMEMRDYGDGILKCVVISVLLLPPRRENVRYLQALQNHIFRLVILSERRGMDCTCSILLAKRISAFQPHVL